MAESKASLAFVRDFLTQGTLPPLPGEAPWEAAVDIAGSARQQGVAGLLHRALDSEGEAARTWPAEVKEALARDRRNALARGVRQLALGARVLDRLDRAGLRALPLKGAALLETLYDSEDERTMADVDLLVLDDWPQARALLAEDGFVECDRADHAAVFRDPDTGAVLELHHSVTSSPGLFPLDRDGLWSRSVPGLGQVPRLPSAEDLLVQLSLHAAFQHGLVLSLAQWLDFRRLFERRSLDPQRLSAATAEARAEAALAAALEAARVVVHAPVPEWLRAVPVRSARLQGRAPLDFVTPAVPGVARVRLALLRGRRLELLRRTLFTETPGEQASFLHRVGRGAARAARLARHWGPETLRGTLARAARGRPACGHVSGTPPLSPADGILPHLLRGFPFLRVTVTGDCMRPALAPGDRVRLVSREQRPPRVGDVVLARHPEGLRLHRLVWGPPLAWLGLRWRTQADRGAIWDPALEPEDVLGSVVEVEGSPGLRAIHGRLTSLRSLLRGLRSWVRREPVE